MGSGRRWRQGTSSESEETDFSSQSDPEPIEPEDILTEEVTDTEIDNDLSDMDFSDEPIDDDDVLPTDGDGPPDNDVLPEEVQDDIDGADVIPEPEEIVDEGDDSLVDPDGNTIDLLNEDEIPNEGEIDSEEPLPVSPEEDPLDIDNL